MLRPEDGDRGANFLTADIHAVALDRCRQGGRNVERFRLFHNMLSSQPMCFNLFAPLVRDLPLATRLLRTLPGIDAERALAVHIEYAPTPASEYLDDGSSFDAFIEYLDADGSRGFVGIETKLTEPFSQKVYDLPTYRRWTTGTASPWRPEAAASVAAIAHNQLWRNHLLAIALRDHSSQRYRRGALLLVRHPLDTECARVVRGYRELLVEGDRTFVDLPLDTLLAGWRASATAAHEQSWLAALTRRYLALEEGEG